MALRGDGQGQGKADRGDVLGAARIFDEPPATSGASHRRWRKRVRARGEERCRLEAWFSRTFAGVKPGHRRNTLAPGSACVFSPCLWLGRELWSTRIIIRSRLDERRMRAPPSGFAFTSRSWAARQSNWDKQAALRSDLLPEAYCDQFDQVARQRERVFRSTKRIGQ